MKKNDITQLHTKDIAALEAQLLELSKQLTQVRIDKKAGKTVKVRVSLLADDIARVKTIVQEKRANQAE